jgi:hypothetical protein
MNISNEAARNIMREFWIPVTRELPEKGVFVISFEPYHCLLTMRYCVDGEWFDINKKRCVGVTHWIPTPHFPGADKKD